MASAIGTLIRKSVDVRDGEYSAVMWSSAYHFFILSAYYVLRPIRDEMGVAGGVENLAWLFSGTLLGMLMLHPIYSALVGRFPRKTFVPLTYRFFILNLIAFFLIFRASDAAQSVWVGRVFFIWVSIFNLFVVSVFWSFMTDIYRPNQSKRLFGMVAVGGTLGAVMGSTITAALVGPLGPINLLLVSALILEVAARASDLLDRRQGSLAQAAADEELTTALAPVSGANTRNDGHAERAPTEIIGGGIFDGIRGVLASPYLLGIAALMLLFTITSTFLYFQQAAIVAQIFGDDREGRTRLFANMDLVVNVLTLLMQVFLTGRVLKLLGVGFALAFLPVVTLVGFGILAVAPVLIVLVIFQVVRRAGNFGIQRPAREVLYTVLPRSDKYKAKNFNDTFIYRVGDQAGAWSYTAMGWLGLGLSGLAVSMVPASIVWLFLALWLGRKYVRAAPSTPTQSSPTPIEPALTATS